MSSFAESLLPCTQPSGKCRDKHDNLINCTLNNCALTSVKSRIVKASMPKDSKGGKALSRHAVPRRPGCRDCPLRASSGKCLDPVLRSGRCGDWVWFVLRGNQQCRCRWVKPTDPRSVRQRRWRARLSTASKRYSRSLTEEQRDACIAAGMKRRSRPRLGQAGALTGQQYSVGKECAAYAEEVMRKATMTRAKVLQPQRLAKAHTSEVLQRQGVARGTWGSHRGMARLSPGRHRGDKGRGRKEEGRRKSMECKRRRKGTAFQARQNRTTALSTGERYRSVTWARPQRAASNSRNSPSPGGRAASPVRQLKAPSRRPACPRPGS